MKSHWILCSITKMCWWFLGFLWINTGRLRLFFCLDIKSVLAKVLLVIQSFPSLTIGDCLGHEKKLKKGKQTGKPWCFSWRTLCWHIQSEVLTHGTAVEHFCMIVRKWFPLQFWRKPISFGKFYGKQKKKKKKKKKRHNAYTSHISSLCSRFCLFGSTGKSLMCWDLPDF